MYWAPFVQKVGSNYGLSFAVAADSQFSSAALMPNDILKTNLNGLATHLSCAIWNGMVVTAVIDPPQPNATPMVQIFAIGTDKLSSAQSWSRFANLDIGTLVPSTMASVRLVVGDDGLLYCFFPTTTGVAQASCDSGLRWSPAKIVIEKEKAANCLLSEFVLWRNVWWVAICNISGTVYGWRAPSLADGPWTQQKLIGQNSPPLYAPSLSATSRALICICSNYQGGYISTVYFAGFPDTVGWYSINQENILRPSLIFDRFRGTVGPQLLGTVALDACAAGVGNQLGAFTFNSAGAAFLVQASSSGQSTTPNLVDAQVKATQNADGTITLNASTPAPNVASAGTNFSFERLTSTAIPTLAKALAQDGIKGLLSTAAQTAQEQPFAGFSYAAGFGPAAGR